ncbi:MAG TPA: twin transmembrane helix small protein [Propylenella sp.]|nr:twin transmembrane helix small protein [Propylenella sp.]
MENLFQALVPIAIGVVAIILLLGLWNMMRGGSARTSQNMMRARVIAQFAAIVIIMTALWIMGR